MLEREGLFYIKLATFRKWIFQSLLTIDPTSGTVHVVGPNLVAPQRIRCTTQQDVRILNVRYSFLASISSTRLFVDYSAFLRG